MNATADQLLDRIAVVVRGNLPPGVTPAYLDGFLAVSVRRHPSWHAPPA